MRAQPTGVYSAQTGVYTPIPSQQPTTTLVYDRTDWEPIVKGGLILLIVLALLGGFGWIVTKSFDHADYIVCDQVKLCNDITRAKVQSEINRAADITGTFVIPPQRTNAPVTVSPPASAPVAAPASSAPAGIASPAPEWGRCFINKDPNNKGYIGSDGLCYQTPHGTPADPRPHP